MATIFRYSPISWLWHWRASCQKKWTLCCIGPKKHFGMYTKPCRFSSKQACPYNVCSCGINTGFTKVVKASPVYTFQYQYISFYDHSFVNLFKSHQTRSNLKTFVHYCVKAATKTARILDPYTIPGNFLYNTDFHYNHRELVGYWTQTLV